MKPATLRQLGGAASTFVPGAVLARAKTAVIFIDYQQEYVAGPLALPQAETAVAAALKLRAWAAQAGLPVMHVLHHAGSPGAPLFAPGSAGAAPLAGLAPGAGEACVIKHLPSAFAGTNLADLLQAGGIETLILAGFMTHNCVDATAREAFHRGFKVAVVADASATRDLPGPDGTAVPAATVHAAVLAGLGDRMAEIVDGATLATLRVA